MRPSSDYIKLTRDTEVVQIPEGLKVRLARGTPVRIMQALGGTYTVMTDYGNMVRIGEGDLDAIGIAPEKSSSPTATSSAEPIDGKKLEDMVWNKLRTVYDPEIPVNVVELGLVYECKVEPLPEGDHRVHVQMSLTAPGCGMGPILQADAEAKIKQLPGVKQAQVDVVFDPPWDPSKMSEAARLELGL